MGVVSEVKFIIPNFSTPDRVKDQWAEVLGVDASRINEKAQAVISGEESFSERLASPSSASYAPMIKSTFRSKSGLTASQIKNNQRVNLKRSYDKWSGKMDYQYDTVDGIPAKRFKDVVNNSKDSMSAGLAERTLPLTGIKVEGRGLVALAAMWLTGDKRVEGMLRPGDDIVFGGAYRICPLKKRFQLRAMLTSQLIYVGAELIKADFLASLRTTLNQLTAEVIQGFTDPGLDLIPFTENEENSFCNFKVDPVMGRILHICVRQM